MLLYFCGKGVHPSSSGDYNCFWVLSRILLVVWIIFTQICLHGQKMLIVINLKLRVEFLLCFCLLVFVILDLVVPTMVWASLSISWVSRNVTFLLRQNLICFWVAPIFMGWGQGKSWLVRPGWYWMCTRWNCWVKENWFQKRDKYEAGEHNEIYIHHSSLTLKSADYRVCLPFLLFPFSLLPLSRYKELSGMGKNGLFRIRSHGKKRAHPNTLSTIILDN